MKCRSCSSTNLKPFTYKPPIKTKGGQSAHICTETCTKTGMLCLNCHMLNEGKE